MTDLVSGQGSLLFVPCTATTHAYFKGQFLVSCSSWKIRQAENILAFERMHTDSDPWRESMYAVRLTRRGFWCLHKAQTNKPGEDLVDPLDCCCNLLENIHAQ